MAKQINKSTKRHPFKDNLIRSRERELYEQGIIFEPAWMADERARLYETKYKEACDIIDELSKIYDELRKCTATIYAEVMQKYAFVGVPTNSEPVAVQILNGLKENQMQQKLAIDKLTIDDIEEGDYE